MNGNGPLDFQVYVGDADFKKTFNSMERRATSFTRHVDKEVSSLDATFARLGQVAAGAFAIGELSQLPGQIVKVRGEFQQLEIALNTMLGSKEKGDKLLSEIVTTAASTPFGLKDLAAATKQLLAYGSASDSVIKEIRMLGDVASGVSVPIGDLVYLYGTLRSQGRAYAVDIRQFAGRGIPIYAELAKVLNVGVGEVNALVEAGKVGFPQVEQAFRNMTSGAGMFSGLMDAQSKSLTGLIERLKDGIDVAFNDIGKANQGLAEDVITGATVVVENYQNVADILTVLIGTYGAYRAALVLVNTMKTTEATSYAAVTAGINAQSGATERAIALETRRAQATALRKTALADEAFALSLNAAAQVQSLRTDVAAAAAKRTATIETAKSAAAEVTSATARLAAAQANQVATANYLSATVREAAAKEVLNAQNALLIASENGVTARKAASAASADFLAKKTALETATKTANSLVTKTNTTAEAAGVATKGAAAVATTRLTSLQALQIAVTRQATAAQLAFNGTLLANPIVLATVGLAALAGAMWYLSDSTTAAELAQKSLNQILEDQKKKKEDLVSKTSELTGVINNESSTTFAQIQAYSTLQKLYPALLNNLTLQEFKLLKAADAQKQLNAAMDQMGISGTNGEFDNANKRIDELTKKLENLKKQQAQAGPGSGAFVAPIARAQTELEAARISAEKLGEQVKQNTADAWEANTPVEEQIKHYQTLQGSLFEQRKTIEESITKMQKMGGTAQGLKPFFDQLTLTGLNQQIDKVAGKLGALMGNKSAVVDGGNKSYWEKVKSDANDKRDNLGIGKSGSSEWKALTKEIDAADKKLQAYSATKKVAERKVPEKDKPQPFGSIAYYEQIARKADEIIAKTPGSNTGEIAKQNKIKIDAEAKADEIRKLSAVKTFDQELEEKKRSFEMYQKWVDAYGQKSADEQFKSLISFSASYVAFLDSEIKKLESLNAFTPLNDKDAANLLNLRSERTEATGGPTKIEQYRDSLEQAREEAGSLTEYLGFLKQAQDALNASAPTSDVIEQKKITAEAQVAAQNERKRLLSEFLVSTEDSEEKRLEIEKYYADLRAGLEDRFQDNKTAGYKKALDAINKAEGDEMRERAKRIREASEEYKALVKSVEDAANSSGLLKQISAQKDLVAEELATNGYSERYYAEFQKLGDMQRTLYLSIADAVGEIGGALQGIGGTMGNIGAILSGIASQANGLVVAFDKNSTSTQKWGSAVQAAASLINIVVSAAKQRKQAEEEYYNSVISQQQQYNLLLNEQIGLQSKSGGSIFFTDFAGTLSDGFAKSEDAITQFEDSLQDLESGLAKTGKKMSVSWQAIGSGAVSGATIGGIAGAGVFSWAGAAIGAVGGAIVGLIGGMKKKDTFAPLFETWPELIDETKTGVDQLNIALAQTLIDNNLVDDATKRNLQSTIAWVEQYKEAQEQISGVISSLAGALGDTLRDGLVNAFIEGTDAAVAFGDSVEKILESLLQQMIFSKVMGPALKKLEEDMTASSDVANGGDGNWIDDFGRFFSKADQLGKDFNQTMEEAQKEADSYGFDLWKKDGASVGKQDPLRGAIQGMSQETASVLSGQFNAIRISNADIMVSMRQSLLYQSRIADNTEFNRHLPILNDLLKEMKTSNTWLTRGFGG